MKLKNILLLSVIFMLLGTNTAFAYKWIDSITLKEPELVNSTYLITSPEEMAWISRKSNRESYSFHTYTIKLMNDIDLSEMEWTPIKDFDGTFDGNNHVINGIRIGSESAPANIDYAGFFSSCSTYGMLKNLGLTNVAIYSKGNYIGGLSGGSANLQSCYVTGVIQGVENVGGLSGGGGNIFSCYADCEVSGETGVGGLAGDSSQLIENCYSLSNVSGTENVGGLAGKHGSSYYVQGIKNCFALGTVSGEINVGGLVGKTVYTNTLMNCYTASNISGTENMGGLIGSAKNPEIQTSFWCSDAVHTIGGTVLTADEKCGIGFFEAAAADTPSKSAEELKSADFAALMNEMVLVNDSWSSWNTDENINNGYLSHGDRFDEKYFWIGNAKEPELINETDYRITSAEELAWIAQQLMYRETFEGYTFYLMNDIDLSGRQWTPIGGFDGYRDTINNLYYTFRGNFEGNNHVITGLTIGTEKYARPCYFNALFGSCFGTVRNLGLENVFINGRNCTGGIIGGYYSPYYIYSYMNAGHIDSCYVTGKIYGTERVGGLAGHCCSITNSYSLADVTATNEYAGGLCGQADLITNCYSIGNVEGGSYVGALSGDSSSTYCYWNAECTIVNADAELSYADKKGIGNGTDKSVSLSSEELKQASSYSGWDFSDVWSTSESINGGMPCLKWQLDNAELVGVTDITLNNAQISLIAGSRHQLTAGLTPPNADYVSVVWSSSDDAVATVDNNGIVTAVAKGEAVITVNIGDASAECRVTVTQSDTLEYQIYSLKLKDASGKQLSQIPDNTFIAEVTVNAIKKDSSYGRVIAVTYDKAGLPLDIEYMPISSDASFSIPMDGKNAAAIRVFVWSNQLTPLAAPAEL